MRDELHKLGGILQAARVDKGFTQERLSAGVGISRRYLSAIENEHRIPSVDVLLGLILELGISADAIFYPEREVNDSERDQLVRMLSLCEKKEIRAAIAMLDALRDGDK